MFALCIESSHERGMGHFYRALNLADALTKLGHECRFIINEHSRSCEILKSRRYLFTLVDLYDYSSGWEENVVRKHQIRSWINDRLNTDIRHASRVTSLNIPLVTFDDRGSGAEYADLHIAALALDETESLPGKRVLRGIDYLILNPEIAKHIRLRHEIKSILVTLGGSDTYGVTVKIVKLLTELGKTATIIVGPAFEHYEELEKVVTSDFIIKKDVPSMIEEFKSHDLAITGGGITPFEANASGLPCIIIANEKFEIPVGTALSGYGGSVFAGYHEEIDIDIFKKELSINEMSNLGMTNVTLHGCQRVVNELVKLIH